MLSPIPARETECSCVSVCLSMKGPFGTRELCPRSPLLPSGPFFSLQLEVLHTRGDLNPCSPTAAQCLMPPPFPPPSSPSTFATRTPLPRSAAILHPPHPSLPPVVPTLFEYCFLFHFLDSCFSMAVLLAVFFLY